MSINKFTRVKIIKRDLGRCIHCGSTEDLAIHHRKNRGMGGSKQLDRLDNLLLICNTYNVAMESNADVRREAIQFGHKLNSWDAFDKPVFDIPTGLWFYLTEVGDRLQTQEQEEGLF